MNFSGVAPPTGVKKVSVTGSDDGGAADFSSFFPLPHPASKTVVMHIAAVVAIALFPVPRIFIVILPLYADTLTSCDSHS